MAKAAAADPEKAPVAEPPMAPAMCKCSGCGMPAVAVTSKLAHCEHHRTWVDSKDANIVRAMEGL